jgi:co-chaperonin GroES (HSP10)
MDYSKLKVLGDKVIVRFTSKSMQDLFSKEIRRVDGSTVRLWLNVDAAEQDDRKATLFVSTGIVINKGPQAKLIEVGDIAILSYEVYNDPSKFVAIDDGDKIVWVNANTTYHAEDAWAYGNRTKVKGRDRFGAHKMFNNDRDQMVWRKGEVEEVSQILGWIRGNEMFANDPYIFLHHEEHEKKLLTLSGIHYSEKPEIITRTVLCSSATSFEKYGITSGDKVRIKEVDTFEVKLQDKKITCVNDVDMLCGDSLVRIMDADRYAKKIRENGG